MKASTTERLLLLVAAAAAIAGPAASAAAEGYMRGTQAQQPQQEAAAPVPAGGTSIDWSDTVRQHGERSSGKADYPACPIQASLNDDGGICAAGSGWLALTQIVPPQLGTGSTVRPPLDPNGDLPRPLQALGKPLPAQVPAATVEAEKPSYYWAYRAIQNLYGAMGAWPARPSDDEVLDLALPAAWTTGRAYRVDGTALTGDAPLAASYTRGDDMLVVIRGTVYAREWCVPTCVVMMLDCLVDRGRMPDTHSHTYTQNPNHLTAGNGTSSTNGQRRRAARARTASRAGCTRASSPSSRRWPTRSTRRSPGSGRSASSSRATRWAGPSARSSPTTPPSAIRTLTWSSSPSGRPMSGTQPSRRPSTPRSTTAT